MNQSGVPSEPTYQADWFDAAVKWRSATQMQRGDSRIDLEVTGIRCERLQAITVADIQAEGVQLPVCAKTHHPLIQVPTPYVGPRDLSAWTEADFWRCAYACAWEERHGRRAPWGHDTWVWAVGFQVLAVRGGQSKPATQEQRTTTQ